MGRRRGSWRVIGRVVGIVEEGWVVVQGWVGRSCVIRQLLAADLAAGRIGSYRRLLVVAFEVVLAVLAAALVVIDCMQGAVWQPQYFVSFWRGYNSRR